MKNEQLLNNQICFLQQNRGSKHHVNKNIIISSEVDFFDITFLIIDELPTIESKMIYLPDWNSHSIQNTKSGCTEKMADLTYMTASPIKLKEWNTNSAIITKKVISDYELELFSIIQTKGFCETEEIYNKRYPFFRKKNFDGVRFKNQHFFIAYMGEIAVSSCIIIDSNNVYGIYGLSTLPEYRKRGIATSIMKSALVNCINTKVQNFTLQTIKGSNAENLYLGLGFKKNFNCQIFKSKK